MRLNSVLPTSKYGQGQLGQQSGTTYTDTVTDTDIDTDTDTDTDSGAPPMAAPLRLVGGCTVCTPPAVPQRLKMPAVRIASSMAGTPQPAPQHSSAPSKGVYRFYATANGGSQSSAWQKCGDKGCPQLVLMGSAWRHCGSSPKLGTVSGHHPFYGRTPFQIKSLYYSHKSMDIHRSILRSVEIGPNGGLMRARIARSAGDVIRAGVCRAFS